MIRWFTNRVRWWWQRRTRGFDDRDIWSLDWTIARFVRPRLELLRACEIGHPGALSEECGRGGFDEWQEILGKMIRAFSLIERADDYDFDDDLRREVDEGLDLFREWFGALWT